MKLQSHPSLLGIISRRLVIRDASFIERSPLESADTPREANPSFGTPHHRHSLYLCAPGAHTLLQSQRDISRLLYASPLSERVPIGHRLVHGGVQYLHLSLLDDHEYRLIRLFSPSVSII